VLPDRSAPDEETQPDSSELGSSDAASTNRVVGGLRAVAGTARSGARTGVRVVTTGARSGTRAVVDRVMDIAPRIPIRDLETLQRHHGGLDGEALAEALVDAAARRTSAFGVAGGVAAVRLGLRRNPLVLAVQLVAEPVAVAATEIKLLAELHEVYDVQVTGSGADRARYFAKAWATARGVNPLDPESARSALGDAVKGNLGRTLAARLGSRFARTGPLVAGAAAGGMVNGQATRQLADAARTDLRGRDGSFVEPLQD
jgi:hypothetical protein